MSASRATQKSLLSILVMITLIALSGCGQKGPLILPADPATPSVATPSVATPQQDGNSDEQENEAEDES